MMRRSAIRPESGIANLNQSKLRPEEEDGRCFRPRYAFCREASNRPALIRDA